MMKNNYHYLIFKKGREIPFFYCNFQYVSICQDLTCVKINVRECKKPQVSSGFLMIEKYKKK